MSTILDRARMTFAAAVASMAGGASLPLRGAYRATWAPFSARGAHYQHSHRTVAQDKRAARKARKARNVKRNKA